MKKNNKAFSNESKNNKTILVFSPYYPPHIGGLETHSYEFNEELSKKHFAINVLTPRLPINASKMEEQNNRVTIYRFPAFEIIPNYPVPKIWKKEFWSILSKSTKNKPNVVISRTRFFLTSPMALLYSKLKRIPWMHIEHGSDYIKMANPFVNLVGLLYDFTVGFLVFRLSTINIAISKDVKTFINKFDKRNVPVIYRGVKVEQIIKQPEDKEFRLRYKNKIILGFVGRLIDGKGVQDLIIAITKLPPDLTNNIQVIIVGDGSYKEVLENLIAENDLNNKVYFTGIVDQMKAISYLKTFDIFINPSYTEGLPSAVLEAALCKRAIIATDIGGTSEIILNENMGLLFKPKDIDMLVKHITYLVNDENRRHALGNNAYKYVTREFNWENSIILYKKYINLIAAVDNCKTIPNFI